MSLFRFEFGLPRLFALGVPVGLLLLLVTACQPRPEPPPPPAKVPVSTEVLEPGPFQPRLRLLGTVEPSQRIEIRSREAGKIRYARRFVDGLRTGQQVEAGELLFRLENDDLALRAAEAELQAEGAEAELKRARRGVEGGFLPDMELKNREIQMGLAEERLRTARAKLKRLEHHATTGGLLTVDAVVAPGTEVTAGQVVARLAAAGAPMVEAWASAGDLQHLRTELEVEVLDPAGRDVVGRGFLRELAGEVDAAGTVRAVVVIEEDLDMPRPGEGVEVEVLLPRRDQVLTVPEEALLIESGVSRGFALSPSGNDYKAEKRLVQTGLRSGQRVEVLYGFEAGERVAVRGAEFLADGLLATEAVGTEGR